MKWEEIVVEGVNFYCPTCDELLGKESELNANDSWHCGNCGWDKSDGGARHEDDPERGQPYNRNDRYQAPTKPAAPAPKPQPKSKQTLVKQSGDFEARVYPGRKTGGLYYLGRAGSHIDISGGCIGEVAKQEDGTFVATRRLMYGRSVNIGSFANMTLAMNALKKRFKGELKRK